MSSLEGRVTLVTGANHGIGAATARLLALRGASVVVSFLRIADSGETAVPESYRRHRSSDGAATADEIRGNGGRAIAIEADLR